MSGLQSDKSIAIGSVRLKKSMHPLDRLALHLEAIGDMPKRADGARTNDSALARAIGTPQPTLAGWRKGGIPPARSIELSARYGQASDWLLDSDSGAEGAPAFILPGAPSRGEMPAVTAGQPSPETDDETGRPDPYALPPGAVVACVYSHEGRPVYGYIVQPLLPVQLGPYPDFPMPIPPPPGYAAAPSSGAGPSKRRATRKRATQGA